MKGHPRVTLLLVSAVAMAGVVAVLQSPYLWVLAPVALPAAYGLIALANATALEAKRVSRHWLWLYLIGCALVPIAIALWPSKQPVDDQVSSLSA